MTPKQLLEILDVTEKLKCNPRHSWTSTGRRESVAEHSWQLALMAMLLTDTFPELNMDQVIRMCLIHDLGEAFTGDIPAFEKTASHEREEEQQLRRWVNALPEETREEFRNLLAEMNAQKTPEAKLYKALDKMEAVIQHDQADLSTWLPLEYQLHFTYGAEQVAFSPWLQELKKSVDQRTTDKIQRECAALEKDSREKEAHAGKERPTGKESPTGTE